MPYTGYIPIKVKLYILKPTYNRVVRKKFQSNLPNICMLAKFRSLWSKPIICTTEGNTNTALLVTQNN